MKGLNLLQKRKLGKGIHHRKLKKGEKGYKRKMEEVIMGYRRGKEQDSIWSKYSVCTSIKEGEGFARDNMGITAWKD